MDEMRHRRAGRTLGSTPPASTAVFVNPRLVPSRRYPVDALLPVMFVFSIVNLLSERRARPPQVPVPDTPLTPD